MAESRDEHGPYVVIELNGHATLVDERDAAQLIHGPWHVNVDQWGLAYIVSSSRPKLSFHRVLLGLAPHDGQIGDHVDGNTLNNRRYNLRIGTPQLSNLNRRRDKRGIHSRYRGVTRIAQAKARPWVARLCGQELGHFANELDAALAYDREAKSRFGRWALPNFPD